MVEEHGGLAEILKYHVVSGVMTAKELTALGSVVSVNGQRLNIDSQPGFHVNGAEVIQSDISASNGIIHVIDRVILPDEGRDSNRTGS